MPEKNSEALEVKTLYASASSDSTVSNHKESAILADNSSKKKSELVNDTWFEIFKFFDPAALSLAAGVSKEWRSIASSLLLWSKLDFPGGKEQFSHFLVRFPRILWAKLVERLVPGKTSKILRVLSLKDEERAAALFDATEIQNFIRRPLSISDRSSGGSNYQLYCSDIATLSFLLGIVKAQQVNLLPKLLSGHVVLALLEKIISADAILKIEWTWNRELLISEIGIDALKKKLISIEQAYLFQISKGRLRDLLTPNGIKALEEKLITPDQASQMSQSTLESLLSEQGMHALKSGLLTLEQARLFYHSASATGNHDVLRELLVPHGIKALQKRLIVPEQACKMPDASLRALFSEVGMHALESGIITAEQAMLFHDAIHAGLRELFIPNGVKALQKKLILPEQACKMTRNTLEALLSDVGIHALESNIITVEQAMLFYHSGSMTGNHDVLGELLVPNGVKALQKRLIVPEQACKMSYASLRALFSEVGMHALESGIITPEQAMLFYHSGSPGNHDVLSELLVPNGIKALQKGLIVPAQACKISGANLRALFSEVGMHALENGIITAEQAMLFQIDGRVGLSELLVPNGVKALQKKLIPPEQACKMTRNTLRALLSDVGMHALESGIITPEQATLFYYSGSMTGNQDELGKLLVPNGVKALQKGLIVPEQACKLSYVTLSALFSEHGIYALENGLITPEQALIFNLEQWHYSSLAKLLSPKGIFALKNKLTTPEQFKKMSESERAIFLSKLEIPSVLDEKVETKSSLNAAFVEKIPTLILRDLNDVGVSNSELKTFVTSLAALEALKRLTTPHTLYALKEKLITFEALSRMSVSVQQLVLPNIIIKHALSKKLITPKIAKLFYPSGSIAEPKEILPYLLTPNGFKALSTGVLTIEQAKKMSIEQLKMVLSDKNLQGLVTPEVGSEIKEVSQQVPIQCVAEIPELIDSAVDSTEQKDEQMEDKQIVVYSAKSRGKLNDLITPEQATKMKPGVLQLLLSDAGLNALKLGLVTAENVSAMTLPEFRDFLRCVNTFQKESTSRAVLALVSIRKQSHAQAIFSDRVGGAITTTVSEFVEADQNTLGDSQQASLDSYRY